MMSTPTVQEALAAREAPDKATLAASGTAVTTPPLQVVPALGVAATLIPDKGPPARPSLVK